MNKLTEYAKSLLEKQLFGVCAGIASALRLRTRQVRLSFIYLSFLTFGSPIFIYLIIAFWQKNDHVWKPWKWYRSVE
ncbi:MAG TPA: PspC domain-containing protein [Flavobacteriales bacterium]